ncbi:MULTISPECIES: TM2 domain-containing protein [Shewanella]|uniref:TM2 domain-containing protein n=1 Tax=Shewanella TaxID=22 RepID=UPI0006D654B0|nr:MULTISPECIES: TM2 domain-containing protein [Shewanella]KPZ67547.1 TM2 domain protein [Shewanella sp. P1-14-1]
MQDVTCPQCSNNIDLNIITCPHCQAAQGLDALSGVDPDIRIKNQKLAILFGFVLGGFGLHKFYLGQHLKGSVYLLFCWTLVPMVVGWVDAIRTLKMSPFNFQQRYSRKPNHSYI